MNGHAAFIVVALISFVVVFVSLEVSSDSGGEPVGRVPVGDLEKLLFGVGFGVAGQDADLRIREAVVGELFVDVGECVEGVACRAPGARPLAATCALSGPR